jgi:hypothetical protein
MRGHYFFSVMLLAHVSAYEESKVVVFVEDNNLVYASQKLLAFCNLRTKACRAFDITDSGLPELVDARKIYNELRDRHYTLKKESLLKNLSRRNTQ